MYRTKAYILCFQAKSDSLYSPWLDAVDHVALIPFEQYDETWTPPEDCGIVISHLHYDHPTAPLLRRITEENRIPVLVLADGILEYRNTFENPKVAPGSLFMPVHGHKIACIGESQARMVECWGNTGKCEVVGLPRLDDLMKNGRPVRTREDRPLRILVATARHPGFTERQIQTIRRSLFDLKQKLDRRRRDEGIQTVWRLSGNLATELCIDAADRDESSTMKEVISTVDAVITTPSTIILESMLFDLPTATIDYTNSPKMVSTAWNITAAEQIESTLDSLLEREPARMMIQECQYQDALQTREPARKRMVRLIERMIAIGNQAEQEGKELNFPDRILDSEPLAIPPHSENGAAEELSLADFFPKRYSFQASEKESLALQFDQMNRRIERMHLKNREKEHEIRAVLNKNDQLNSRLQESLDQIESMKQSIKRLKKNLRMSQRPNRVQKRLRLNGSIAFQRWLFFVQQALAGNVRKETQHRKTRWKIDELFDWTLYRWRFSIPVTVKQKSNRKKAKFIRIWKNRPTRTLIGKLKRAIANSSRKKMFRVMKA